MELPLPRAQYAMHSDENRVRSSLRDACRNLAYEVVVEKPPYAMFGCLGRLIS